MALFCRGGCGGEEVGDDVVAASVEAGDFGDGLDTLRWTAAFDEDQDVDRLGDQAVRHRDHGFLDELFEPIQCGLSRARVQSGDPAGMAGVLRLQHVECFGAAYLADDDAVRPKPQCRADQGSQQNDAGHGAQRHVVRRGALQFPSVFDQQYLLVEAGDHGEQGVGEGGLAGAGAADDQDVAAIDNRPVQNGGLVRR